MITIRPETPADISAIYTVNKRAFRDRDAEPALVDAIRASEAYVPGLSLVAEEDGQVVGHILFSRIHIATENGVVPAIALAPMAVLPEYQGKRIGSALVQRGLEACREQGYEIVIVLGHPWFYPRFGFSADLAKPLECPWGDCGAAWMALELSPGALSGVRGKVVYPPLFDSV